MRVTELARRIEAGAASDGAALVAGLRQLEPDGPAQALEVAGGQLVLLGPGMYVNRAIGLGHHGIVGIDDVHAVERASAAVGVPAEVEVCPLADPSLLESLAGRGYEPHSSRGVWVRDLSGHESLAESASVAISPVQDDAGLVQWQETSARAFERDTPEERDIGARFAAAWSRVPGVTLYLAHLDGLPVATAVLTLRAGVATLAGMSTLPEARRRGVQQALLARRLSDAVAAGYDLAVSTTAPGSVSERNLGRAGLSLAYTQLTVRRSPSERGHSG